MNKEQNLEENEMVKDFPRLVDSSNTDVFEHMFGQSRGRLASTFRWVPRIVACQITAPVFSMFSRRKGSRPADLAFLHGYGYVGVQAYPSTCVAMASTF